MKDIKVSRSFVKMLGYVGTAECLTKELQTLTAERKMRYRTRPYTYYGGISSLRCINHAAEVCFIV